MLTNVDRETMRFSGLLWVIEKARRAECFAATAVYSSELGLAHKTCTMTEAGQRLWGMSLRQTSHNNLSELSCSQYQIHHYRNECRL
jgi:hypothetical protein